MKPNILLLESRNPPMGYGVFLSQDCIMSHDVSVLTTWQEGDQSERKKRTYSRFFQMLLIINYCC